MKHTKEYVARGFFGLGDAKDLPGMGGGAGADPRSGEAARLAVCRNLTVEDDGTLSVREGFQKRVSTEADCRAVYAPSPETTYLLAGNTVYREEDGTLTAIGTVSGSAGKAAFCPSYGKLWLATGNGIYEIDGDGAGVATASGYAPLIGKDWPCGRVGEKNESENLLSPYVRISYDAGDAPSQYLATGRAFAEVTALFVNGARRSPDTYSIDPDLCTVNVSGIGAHDRILLCGRFETPPAETGELSLCRELVLFGGADATRLCAFGGGNGKLFFAAPVKKEDAGESRELFGGCGEIWFRPEEALTVGDGTDDPVSVLRAFGRLFVLGGREAWLGEPGDGSGKLPMLRVKEDFGARVCGAVSVGGVPYVLTERELLAVDGYRAENDDVRLTSLVKHPPKRYSQLFYDRRCDRLLALYRDENGLCADVCDRSGGRRSLYGGLPDGVFYADGDGTGVMTAEGLYRCGGSDDGDDPVEAEAVTVPLDFGTPERRVRVRSLSCETAGGKTLTLSIAGDAGTEEKTVLSAEGTVTVRPGLPYGRIFTVGFCLSGGQKIGAYRLSLRGKEKS